MLNPITRALRPLTATAAIGALTLLTACAPSDAPAPEQATNETAAASSSTAPEDFETGPYRGEPQAGWSETKDEIGPLIESNMIGFNTLLPYEVDPEFSEGAAARAVDFAYFGDSIYSSDKGESLLPLESRYLRGYVAGGKTAHDRLVFHEIYRFTDADAAQEAVDTMFNVAMENGRISDIGEVTPLDSMEIPGRPEARGIWDILRDEATIFEPHNEFVIMATLKNPADFDPDKDKEEARQAQAWMPGYAAEFLSKQAPLIDTIPTRKTEAGFGMNEGWAPVDPDDILKYVVMNPEDEEFVGKVPAAVNKRMMASNWKIVPEMLTVIDKAEVSAMAQGTTLLFRTGDNPKAELIRATINAATGEDEGVKEYEDPQGIPGTTCTEHKNDYDQTIYDCSLVYENYYATAQVLEEPEDDKPEVGGNETTSAAQENEIDGRTRLSYIMAAQYKMLQSAPKAK